MPKVYFSSSQRRLTGGLSEIELPADNVSELLEKLELRFPGLSQQLNETSASAVAIIGDVIPNAGYTHLPSDAEVLLVPAIAGG